MEKTDQPTGHHTFKGTVRVLSSELLILPTGILIVSFLTRRLGPHEFGLFILTSTIVAWIEWSISTIFGRATIKLVGETKDWKPVAGVTTRFYLIFSLFIMVLLLLLAGPIAHAMNEPALAGYLRLFSLDIPIFGLAQAHRQLLIGIGAFTQRAYLSVARWIGRFILIVILVQLGLSIHGAILGCIAASCIEVIVGRYFIQVPLFAKSDFDSRRFWNIAASLSLSGLSMRTFDKLDILMLKLLGGSTAIAGFYGAAQNLSILPGIFALSFSPVLLATLSRLLRIGDHSSAKALIKDSIRITVLLLPFGAIVAGSSLEIVQFFFGHRFASTAPLLSLLIFSALCVSISSATSAIITASEKPHWTFRIVGPCVPFAIVGHFLFIPKFGALGAAIVTTCLSILLAIISMIVVYHMWKTLPAIGTFLRTFAIGIPMYFACSYWHAEGLLLILKLCSLGLVVIIAYLLLGEFTTKEIEIVRSFVLNRRRIEPGV